MDEIKTILSIITWPGAAAFGSWVILRLYPMYLNKSSGNGNSTTTGAFKDARIDELMRFKLEAETNHWHDIEALQESQSRIWEKLAQHGEQLAYIRAKIESINQT